MIEETKLPIMETTRWRDWTQLPPDLLSGITDHLQEFADLIRFRSVCRKFRSIFVPPWVLLPYSDSNYRPDGGYIRLLGRVRFLSISDKRLYSAHFPEFRSHRIYPSPRGSLIAVSDQRRESRTDFSISLVSPVTLSSIRLPPISSDLPHQSNIRRLKLSRNGPELVVGFLQCAGHHLFCSPGDSAWRKIRTRCPFYLDFVLHNGSFYLLMGSRGTTEVFDVGTCTMVSEVEPVEIEGSFLSARLVESPFRELLLVVGNQVHFEVYRLDESEQRLKWVRVTGIGDCAIFIDMDHAMCLPLNGVEGYKANCIYFLDRRQGSDGFAVRVFDIGEDRFEVEPLVSYESGSYWGYHRWFVPCLC